MSVKHIKAEYERICKDYKELLDTIHDLEDAVQNNLISPEQLEQVTAQVEVIKANWRRWSYVIFLLDQPNKPKKQKKYRKQHNVNFESEHLENQKMLSNFKSDIKGLN